VSGRPARLLLHLVLPVAALLIIPVFITSFRGQTQATTAVIYAIVGLGLGLVYGQLGLLAMSHAGLWGVGAYTAAILMRELDLTFWPAFAGAVVVSLVIGAVTALPAFRLKGHHLLIVGFIVTELIVVVGQQWESLTGGITGIVVTEKPGSLFGADLASFPGFYYLSVGVLLVLVAFSAWLRHLPLGRRFVAVRENTQLANSVGLDDRVLIIAGYALSGIFAGAGGALFAVNLEQIQPDQFGLTAAILLPLVVMVGGARRLWGPVVGAFIVVVLPEVIGLDPEDAQAVNGLLLIAIILLMPNGVLGGLGPIRERFTRRGQEEVPVEAAS